MRGFFESPVQHLPISAESRAAYFELLLPDGAGPRLKPPVCLLLASGNEQGFHRRRRTAMMLLQHGVGALILENPYQGKRRPAHQAGRAVSTVAEQLLMHWMTIAESRSLLNWLRQDGYEHLGVTGIGLGGFMAAYVGALTSYPLAIVPCSTGMRPSTMLSQSVMSTSADWVRLQAEQQHGTARELMTALLDHCALDHLGAPADTDLAILVGARRDGVVHPSQVEALAKHWGAPVYWSPGGHFSAAAYRGPIYRDALLDAFGTQLAKYTPSWMG